MKVRHVLSEAQVRGDLDPRSNTLTGEELRVKRGGGFQTVWTNAEQSAEWAYFVGTGGLGPAVRRPPGR